MAVLGHHTRVIVYRASCTGFARSVAVQFDISQTRMDEDNISQYGLPFQKWKLQELVNLSEQVMEESEYESLPTENIGVHMLAGAFAGIMEHCVMYPVDFVKVVLRLYLVCLLRFYR